MALKLGKSIVYEAAPTISYWAACVGKKEGEGPFKDKFDKVFTDTTMGKASWEESESEFIKAAAEIALAKGKLTWADVDCIFSGDLLSQCIASNYAFSEIGAQFCGLYGACSTMALALINGANLVETGAAGRVLAATGSHFCSSERQFRFPLEYGSQRAPTTQWTVTGAGAAVIESGSSAANRAGVRIRAARFGEIKDLGITDAGNMGAAMAPAASATIAGIMQDLKCDLSDFDTIVTGDLGHIGSDILYEYLRKEYALDIEQRHEDCGKLIFERERQDVHGGGSGAGCSASMLCAHFLGELAAGNLQRILFVPTGALLSATTVKQGRTIPSIAHAVVLETTIQS